ncbi:hypothetical protein TBLA_0A03370 [Henningerozyma blattae CBS 6284]|uniref:PH domain-containing protein n=1 Tax=Henningerozyma blattae (strain ATCC 34711 / CBS 6284 / DSM 70876 / NBRC 10599 / NRRL Y-10934 / UCD 77-7) TaxID=1071380 RepID=I2GVI5_HENB6|nr:hypothetical protein TBLA_0A03370 [Tetrapisispora blattae CBS 6284]CCH58137.1 hypothetical protein TBLA_0A03370 [Tetrapisispora blattae CBS 6284]
MSMFVKNAAASYLGEFNGGRNPFTEEYEVQEKSRLHGTVRAVIKSRDKPIPEYIPSEIQHMIKSVRKKAYRRELMFRVSGIKFGWLNVLQLLPVVGGLIGLYFQYSLILEIQEVIGKIPADLKAKFSFNIIVDFLLNLIPIIGDFLSALYKPNCRNVMALEAHLDNQYRPGKSEGFFSSLTHHSKKTEDYPPSSVDTKVDILSGANTINSSAFKPSEPPVYSPTDPASSDSTRIPTSGLSARAAGSPAHINTNTRKPTSSK